MKGATPGTHFKDKTVAISIHAPVKGATMQLLKIPWEIHISIHAPVKGATRKAVRLVQHMDNFNPRTREGCDSALQILITQLRHYFNPRTREGCDQGTAFIAMRQKMISIHAPVKGATPSSKRNRRDDHISIHAPVKGATLPYRVPTQDLF